MSDYSSRYRTAQKRVPPRNPWIEQQLKAGVPRERVLAALEGEGWTAQEADAAIAASTPRIKHRKPTVSVSGRRLALALGASLLAAVLGGLAWALAVIGTGYDIGIVAWVVGVLAASALVRVAGGAVGVPLRVAAAVAAAGGILLGKYVVYVHDLRDAVRSDYGADAAARVGYLSAPTRSFFVDHFTTVVQPIYLVWIAIAALASIRMAGRAPHHTAD